MDPTTAIGLSVWHVILLFVMLVGAAVGWLRMGINENRNDIKKIKEERAKSVERLAKAETKVKNMESDHKGFDEKFNKINEKIDTLLERMADVKAFIDRGN